jgi:16S rRNA (guanine966-N2)-methyltransferase
MRIIAGERKGTALAPVGKGDEGARLRPTPDRVRESLFNLLSARLDWEGLRILDLFAGTGALGLEALSRGAFHATFVENGRAGQRLIQQNIDKLRYHGKTQVMPQDATKVRLDGGPFDLVFLDPPYGKDLGAKALMSVRAQLSPKALAVWEENAPQSAPMGYELIDTRRYGGTYVSLLILES